jgi:adenylyltransferase/sulfurtransferase
MEERTQSIKSEILSDKEIRRYALQINFSSLKITGQEKIKRSKILVIGAGGKGSSVLQNLASAGVGAIGICDNSIITEDLLCKQYLFGDGDLGKQKAIVAREKLLQINQLNEYRLHNLYLTEDNFDRICSDYDILVDATDNFPTHYLINDAAIRMGKAFVFGRIEELTGYVSVFNYKGGPSLRCLYPEPPRKTKKYSDGGFASQAVLVSIIGSYMANEALKVCVEISPTLNGNLLSVDIAKYQIGLVKITKDPSNFR